MAEKPRRETKKKSLDDYVMDMVDGETFEKLKNKVNRLESEIKEIKSALDAAAKKNEELVKELNKRDVVLDEMAAEIETIKTT